MPKAMGRASAKSVAPKKSMTTSQEAADKKFLCYCCGNEMARSNFYISTDPFNSVGVTPYCKGCLEKIARNYNNNYKEFGDVTKASLMAACERADVPFIETIWDGGLYFEVAYLKFYIYKSRQRNNFSAVFTISCKNAPDRCRGRCCL